MDALSMFEKLEGIWSVKNEEESGRRSSETGVQRPDDTGPVGHGKGSEFYFKRNVDKCTV